MSNNCFYETEVRDDAVVLKVTPAKVKLFSAFNISLLIIIAPIFGGIGGLIFVGIDGFWPGTFYFQIFLAALMLYGKKRDDAKRKPVEIVINNAGIVGKSGELITKESVSFFKITNKPAKLDRTYQLSQASRGNSSTPVLVAQAGTLSGAIVGTTVIASSLLQPGKQIEAAHKAFVISISYSILASCRGKDHELVFGLSENAAEALINEITTFTPKFWQ